MLPSGLCYRSQEAAPQGWCRPGWFSTLCARTHFQYSQCLWRISSSAVRAPSSATRTIHQRRRRWCIVPVPVTWLARRPEEMHNQIAWRSAESTMLDSIHLHMLMTRRGQRLRCADRLTTVSRDCAALHGTPPRAPIHCTALTLGRLETSAAGYPIIGGASSGRAADRRSDAGIDAFDSGCDGSVGAGAARTQQRAPR